ncbi:ABC transporter ATP-binding protein [Aminobacter sp. J44]|uniref:oligopeptide/dipeptide ABC transporter ATP-binding protein n=1 Tax=Aminobacter sp. J44 TaxID=935262 RepID=UPI0011998AC5|nr:ABC transporter ATP-binding protein [Aminobacter sp. J44]TWG53204.1 peptide/nickel transport system ATP-binding protein [Aminobacter sp. J44]
MGDRVPQDTPVLEIRDLSISIKGTPGARPLAKDVNLTIRSNEAIGIIGESGSGKSTVALAVLNYLARNLEVVSGSIRFCGETDLLNAPRSIYGNLIAHVAQDPMAALNPIMRIGKQLCESLRLHLGMTTAEAKIRAIELLNEVRLPNAEAIFESLPHELSGGMQQRVCIAMALACDPKLIILDEPTTGLDARTESAVLELLQELKNNRDLSILIISHNLAAVADVADKVAVMYAGRVVEMGPTSQILQKPAHRYTQMLLSAVPRMDGDRPLIDAPWQEAALPTEGCAFRSRCDLALAECSAYDGTLTLGEQRSSRCVRAVALLEGLNPREETNALHPKKSRQAGDNVLTVSDLSFSYSQTLAARGNVASRALDDVRINVRSGSITALIGESGSGKSTLARLIVGLLRPSTGSIKLGGQELGRFRRYPLEICRRLQIVFQNVAGSLHPGKRALTLLARPFQLYERRMPSQQELRELLSPVGLRTDLLPKRITALSGGERQRLALARATAPNPDILVLDEAFSALDVSMKVRVARYLMEQSRASGAAQLLVTHELPFVRYLADDVVVLYRGWVCENGPASQLFTAPYHPYTETLIWAARRLEGQKPKRTDLFRVDSSVGLVAPIAQRGCPFHTACSRRIDGVCNQEAPPEQQTGTRRIACHIPLPELERIQKAEYE